MIRETLQAMRIRTLLSHSRAQLTRPVRFYLAVQANSLQSVEGKQGDIESTVTRVVGHKQTTEFSFFAPTNDPLEKSETPSLPTTLSVYGLSAPTCNTLTDSHFAFNFRQRPLITQTHSRCGVEHSCRPHLESLIERGDEPLRCSVAAGACAAAAASFSGPQLSRAWP